ncbi:MAG: hypothetical protein WKG07_13380 [Hymenobacter sp.]
MMPWITSKFGRGTVAEVSGAVLTVEFKQGGVGKKLSATFASLLKKARWQPRRPPNCAGCCKATESGHAKGLASTFWSIRTPSPP